MISLDPQSRIGSRKQKKRNGIYNVNYAGKWKQAKKGGLEGEGAEGKSERGRMEASKFEGNMGIMT